MNSTYAVGVGALILVGIFFGQIGSLPGVAQRLPVLLIWIVGALAVMMIIEEVLKQRRLKRPENVTTDDRPAEEIDQTQAATTVNDHIAGDIAADKDAPVGPDDELPPINWTAAVSFSLALLAYVWLIPIAGYVVTTTLFMAGVLLVSKTIRPMTAILIAVGVTAFVWLVFVWALGLPVPLLPWLN